MRAWVDLDELADPAFRLGTHSRKVALAITLVAVAPSLFSQNLFPIALSRNCQSEMGKQE